MEGSDNHERALEVFYKRHDVLGHPGNDVIWHKQYLDV